MPFVSIRCYAELNDLLPSNWRFITFPLSLPPNTFVQDVAQTIGIPFDRIDLVLVNNQPVCLSYCLKENDRVAFYPVFENFDISSLTKVRNHPLRQPKFVLDVHLGKLAHHLRMLGFDTLYQNNWTKESMLTISRNEDRVLLSKSKSLLSTKPLTHAHLIKNSVPRFQLLEVLDWFDLYSIASPFSRCIACNSKLQVVEKETVLPQIPRKVQEWCKEYQWCSSCKRIYWKGSHYTHMNAFVQSLFSGHSNTDNPDGSD
jgi:uncharacterized protein with PIN domain